MTFGDLARLLIRGESAPTFDVIDGDSIDPAVFGLTSYADTTTPEGRIGRQAAIQCGPVKRSRDLIPGVLGTLPIKLTGPDRKAQPWSLFDQPEPDVPRSVTMTKTFEDLFFEKVAWWYVLETGWHTYPTSVRRLDARSVDVRPDGRVHVTTAGHRGMVEEWPSDGQLIRFDSPNDGLLTAASAAIRVALMVQKMTKRNVDGTPPVDYFTPAEGADPAEDDEVTEILDAWHEARLARSTGYVPAALKYNVAGFDPEKLQLKDIRRDAALEIAQHAGVDPEDLGISTTSRTYANMFDRRKNFTDFTLGSYITAMQDRLRMNDVTPRGYTPALDLSYFQRSDDKTRYEAYKLGKEAGALTAEEIREAEGKPPIPKADLPTPAPALPPALPAGPRAVPDPEDRRAV